MKIDQINIFSKKNFFNIFYTLFEEEDIVKAHQLFLNSYLNESDLVKSLAYLLPLLNIKSHSCNLSHNFKDQKDLLDLTDFFISIVTKIDLQNFHNFKYENQINITNIFTNIEQVFIDSLQRSDLEFFNNAKHYIINVKEKNVTQITKIDSQKEIFDKFPTMFSNDQYAEIILKEFYLLFFQNLFFLIEICYTQDLKIIEKFLNFLMFLIEKIKFQDFYNLEINNQVLIINNLMQLNYDLNELYKLNFLSEQTSRALYFLLNTKINVINIIKTIFICEELEKFNDFEIDIQSPYFAYNLDYQLLQQKCLELYKPIKLLLSIENQNFIHSLRISKIIFSFIMLVDKPEFWANYKIVKNLSHYLLKQNYSHPILIILVNQSIKHNNFKMVEEIFANFNGNNISSFTLDEKSFNNSKILFSLIENYREEYRPLFKTLVFNQNINVNVKDDFSRTALMYAVVKRKKEIVDLLLKCPNIDINLQTKDGNTAFSFAHKLEYYDIMDMINEHIQANDYQQHNFKPDSSPSHLNSCTKSFRFKPY